MIRYTRDWYIGCALAFQAKETVSSTVSRSILVEFSNINISSEEIRANLIKDAQPCGFNSVVECDFAKVDVEGA